MNSIAHSSLNENKLDEVENPIMILNQIIKNFPKLKNKIMINESELSEILGRNFSINNLEKMRREGRAIINYIQPIEGGRVLYPLIYLCELLADISIANKNNFIINQINNVTYISNDSFNLTENQVAKILGISPSTIADYRKKGVFAKKLKNKFYTKPEIGRWLLKSTIQVA